MDSLDLSTVFARNCRVQRIEKPVAAVFLEKNHRLGDTGARYRYGLFVERTTSLSETTVEPGTLVAVATFSGARKWVKSGREIRSYEWVRYASAPGLRVVGGMGKCLQAFIDEVHPDDVMSYADACWSDGDAYRALGFKCEGMIRKPGFECLKFRLKLTDYNSSV